METKLTLKLDAMVIRRAKCYIKRHKGNSLSQLVENYFSSLTKEEKPGPANLPPIVSSLAGAAKKAKGMDLEKNYTDYLIRKY